MPETVTRSPPRLPPRRKRPVSGIAPADRPADECQSYDLDGNPLTSPTAQVFCVGDSLTRRAGWYYRIDDGLDVGPHPDQLAAGKAARAARAALVAIADAADPTALDDESMDGYCGADPNAARRVFEKRATTKPAPLDTPDLPPLTADELQHFTWLATSRCATPILTKPQLARLLDDRARLIAALRELLRDTGSPYLAEAAERVLTRVDG